jgi:hypothetical protein
MGSTTNSSPVSAHQIERVHSQLRSSDWDIEIIPEPKQTKKKKEEEEKKAPAATSERGFQP